MRKFYYLLIFALIASMAVSCDDGDDSVDRILELDAQDNKIALTDTAQEKFVKVTTDKTNSFDAVWQGDAWGKITPSTEGFTIIATANGADDPRTATILVVLAQGDQTAKITVTQDGREPLVGTLPSDLWFSQYAGSKELLITTNQSDWEVTIPTADWVTVVTDRPKGRLIVDVIENTLEEDRSIDIVLKAAKAGVTKTIKVTQSQVMTYIMPYMGFGKPIPDIRAFEENRGSTYYYGREVVYVWKTPSKVMPEVRYTLDESNRYFLNFGELYYEKALFNDTKYTEVLNKEGYKYLFNEQTAWGTAKVFWKEPNLISINMEMVTDPRQGYILFSEKPSKPMDPSQSDPIPTFASYPYGFHKIGCSFDEVKAWETANGGVLYDDQTANPEQKALRYTTKSLGGPVIARMYSEYAETGISGVTQFLTVVDDVSLALFPASMNYMLTKEFKALLAKDGWVQLADTFDSNYYFIHNLKNLGLIVSVSPFVYPDGQVYDETLNLLILPKFSMSGVIAKERSIYKTPLDLLKRANKREIVSPFLK